MRGKKRVAIYIRKAYKSPYTSREDALKEKLINYCDDQGWIVDRIYRDIGYAGTNLDRPDLQKLLKDIETKTKTFSAVLTSGLSVISRSLEDTLYIKEALEKNEVELLELKDSVAVPLEIAPVIDVLSDLDEIIK